ncbi:MAG: hypothetical protein QM673_00195 [Gordonia sp. (in: high G+C Gram-positive bacteria)]
MKLSVRKRVIRRTAAAAAVVIATVIVAGCSDDNTSSSSGSESASAAASMTMPMPGDTASAASGASAGSGSVELTAADGTKVTLTGPIAAKYQAATQQQKTALGAPKSGADASGTGSNGVVFQQFAGGVITAKDADAATPAYITWGKIRDAWNVKRAADGTPAADGNGGSQGPLGVSTSDETDEGGVKQSTFEHGKITWNSATDQVEVTVNGKVVPAR